MYAQEEPEEQPSLRALPSTDQATASSLQGASSFFPPRRNEFVSVPRTMLEEMQRQLSFLTAEVNALRRKVDGNHQSTPGLSFVPRIDGVE